MIYARVRPEEKETILLACEKAGLSMSDFIVGASLEAAECVIEKYRSLPHSLDLLLKQLTFMDWQMKSRESLMVSLRE